MASLEARLDNLLATAQEETANDDLFAPIPEREECPICMIPLPRNDNEIRFMICCGKTICVGCNYKQSTNDTKNKVPNHKRKCAFCCQPPPKNNIKALKKLAKKNNLDALKQMAVEYRRGENIFQSNAKSIEMHMLTAELGNADAFTTIGYHYHRGIIVKQDDSKAFAYYEVGAKKGSLRGHNVLAALLRNGNIQTSIKHVEVVASAGDKDSMDELMARYKAKLLSKDDLTKTLRAFQASSNAMKSKDRDDARAYMAAKGIV